MDYGNKLRKREPHLLYTGNSQGGNRLRPCLLRRFRNGNLSVDEENGRTQSVSEHAARRRLCRKSIAGSTHYRYCCRNGRKGAACHSHAGCDYLSTGYSDALPHRRSCPERMERRSGDAYGAHGQRTVYVDRKAEYRCIQVYNDIGRIPSILQPGCRCRRRTTAYLPHIGRRTGRTVYSQQGSDLYSQGRPARPDNDHDRNGKHRMAL